MKLSQERITGTKKPSLWKLIIFSVLVVYAAFISLLFFSPVFQRSMIFLNWLNIPRNARFNECSYYGFRADEFKSFTLNTSDGGRIGLWEFELKDTQKKTVALFVHGNAGNRADYDHIGLYKRFTRQLGVFLVVVDYCGFGDSLCPEGSDGPSEDIVAKDVSAAWDYVDKKYENYRKVLIGHSLGTPLSSRLAYTLCSTSTNSCPDALVLLSTVHSVIEVMTEYPGFNILLAPLMLLSNWKEIVEPYIVDHFNTSSYLQELSLLQRRPEVLLGHGTADREVNYKHSRRLFTEMTGFSDYDKNSNDSHDVEIVKGSDGTSFKHRKNIQLLEIPYAGHNDIQNYFNILFDTLEQYL